MTFVIGVCCGGIWIRRSMQSTPAVSDRNETRIPVDTLISLERTGCYGTCPTYSVAISGDGTVIFTASYFGKENGVNQWKRSGIIRSSVTAEQLEQLLAAFKRADYFSLQDFYRDARDGCPSTWTDMSSAYSSIEFGGRKKRIEHYLGCTYAGSNGGPYPKQLAELEESIDRIVDTKRWMQ
jgi:hypothetical protein